MFRDLLEIIRELIRKTASSRLFILGIICFIMYTGLVHKLFNMQIINGEKALSDYLQLTEQTITTAGTRGNIYDRNGKVLAYNKLAYSVMLQDTGAYKKSDDKNRMYLRLVKILQRHGETVQGKFEVALDSNGDMVYTSSSESARKRFLRDYYGLKRVEDLDDEKGRYPSNLSARELFERVRENNGLNDLSVTDQEALDIINIKYALRLMLYRKYESTAVATEVSDETVADILEHVGDMQGVTVEESTIRAYNDSIPFAPVIGYTSKVPEEQLEDLQSRKSDYDINDIVGRTGIEYTMENELQGTKGKKTIYKDSVGRIRETKDETDASAGNDVYLTLNADLQKGIYHLIEQSLAGVLIKTIVNGDYQTGSTTDGSNMKIPVKDAYFQLINNNVLSLKEIESEDASDTEKNIYRKYEASQRQIFDGLKNELMSPHATVMKDLPDDTKAYLFYIYSYLSEPTVGIIKEEAMDKGSDAYKAWKTDEISLREFLYYGIANGWIDSTKLETDTKYSSADDTFKALVDYVLDRLKEDRNFTKKIYRYLINSDTITGQELCLALYDQGVLKENPQDMAELKATGDAYSFLLKKLSALEITPAQLALSPCNAGVVVTNDKTGEVLALVSYPGYDNNRIGDGSYFSQLQADLSLPLYNNATQTRKAPGSTFKPITAVAALEEHAITADETIDCTGIYTDVEPPIKCWIYSGQHGPLNIVGGIENSCNYFFADLGHRLSTDGSGVYSPDAGLEVLRRYASKFGLDHKSGVEIGELDPQISKEAPERSAMGQGSHAYTNVQLSRYVAAIANRGTVFELSLLDKTTDSEGNLIEDYTPEISSHIDAADSTWDTVQQGMREVIANGSTKRLFADLEVEIAGKTGTAQEARNKPNHAFFISYAPYDNPEICVTVNIPYGYSSSNAANIAKNVYKYYYGYIDLESIVNAGALDAAKVNIRD
ncbi:penicillin-binding transpeptidase domain-containing protein [Clostridium boliviensis]|uniref:Penicillin-binding transpeptidase domain-containing protein n=1 Tax=Clostridium boliviensis TaxID=318465 RepID=A0ABU4GPJ3_9CLOT|nr:penicillin-binding transpeptidase domain-containing protein [Clostridium boliviensis]MDW2799540.1 penicillin-binding transpeptidase domain-containing protein [Clostridium boliviensis]